MSAARVPRTIAVDLTPLLPGGANGGAKIFVVELLKGLVDLAASTTFVLLTRDASHDELAVLDRPNVRRVMVLGADARSAARPIVKRVAQRILPMLPNRMRQAISRVAYRANAFLKRGAASRSLLRDLDVDLLFCPFTAPIYAEAGTPTVCTVYDLQYKAFPDFFTPEEVALRASTFAQACRHATLLAAISDHSRDSAIAEGSLDPARIRTIHLRLGDRFARVASDHGAVLDRLALVPGRYLVYPANFWQHKNHEMLLTAFGMACRSGLPSDIRLVCTGSPGERADWIAFAAGRLALTGRVVFPGYVSNGELADLMRHAGAMIFPSLYEGFGLPVIEAMSAGVPVACSGTTSLPEVADGAAVLFDPRVPHEIARAITSLMTDDALRETLRQNGYVRAAAFTDQRRMVDEYWALCVDAMATGRGATR